MIDIVADFKPSDLARRFENIPRKVFAPEFRRMVLEAEGFAKENVTGGNPLHVRTNRLRSSINTRVEEGPEKMVGHLGSNVKYARIHELGGVIPAHMVVPRTKSVLRFSVGGQIVFAKYAMIPAITMPKRPYLLPAAQKAMERFVDRVSKLDLVEEAGGSK